MADAEAGPVWRPRNVADTNVWKFIEYVNKKHNLVIRTYEDLHRWSVSPDSLPTFWQEAYSWLRLAPGTARETGCMLKNTDVKNVDMFPPPKFFPSEHLNIAELMLRDRNNGDVAIHFARDGVPGKQAVTWGDFRERIRRIRSAMVNMGIGQTDVVAAVISNSVDAMAICLAALSVGAVWSSSSCDLGTAGIVDRYKQINPTIVFADNGYIYAEKTISLAERVIDWSHQLGRENPRLKHVVVVNYTDTPLDVSRVYRGCDIHTFLEKDNGAEMDYTLVPFSHAAFILYSSGTGVALKVKTDMSLQHDVRRSDVVFQYTTFTLTESRVSVFGTSPRYLAALKGHGVTPRQAFDLSRLRVVTSTGSTLSAELYNWFYSTGFPDTTHLISMSGGTDIAGSFVGGSPMLPVIAGEIQCKALGMSVDIYDASRDDPVSVEDLDQPGELVCTKPFPSQPLAFIGEKGAERYKSSYFERFGTKVWCQGDFIKRDRITGGLVMLGRSDGVLNPSGVRFGSAEIYAVTETFPEISDSICIGQRREVDEDERVLLFVKMHAGFSLDSKLQQRINAAIRCRYSPRHVPKFTFEVDDIPYTVNGKKCEINIKNIVNGREQAVSGAVSNPNALKLYEQYINLPPERHTARPTKPNL
ncbi:acetoacetate- ligase [Fusarium agapanthi]|uniref:Acetoacetate- ligase n=1 Tax=Fusarium agapanthi TaxID=1803897 RepID=A0A9P5B1N3_9HYPO|nr:acetoacetate- ligase [Fusarium agapanthi]